jgi:acetyl esterase/lipase
MSRSLIEVTNNTANTLSVTNPTGHIILLQGAGQIDPKTSKVHAASIGDPPPSTVNTGSIDLSSSDGRSWTIFIRKVSKHNVAFEVTSGSDSSSLRYGDTGDSHGDDDYHGLNLVLTH